MKEQTVVINRQSLMISKTDAGIAYAAGWKLRMENCGYKVEQKEYKMLEEIGNWLCYEASKASVLGRENNAVN